MPSMSSMFSDIKSRLEPSSVASRWRPSSPRSCGFTASSRPRNSSPRAYRETKLCGAPSSRSAASSRSRKNAARLAASPCSNRRPPTSATGCGSFAGGRVLRLCRQLAGAGHRRRYRHLPGDRHGVAPHATRRRSGRASPPHPTPTKREHSRIRVRRVSPAPRRRCRLQ